MNKRVEVSAEDIQKGKSRSALFCPIARALEKATGEVWSVAIEQSGVPTASHFGVGVVKVVILPDVCAYFIQDFDLLQPVDPFAFECEVPA